MYDDVPDRIDVVFHGDDDVKLTDDDRAKALEGFVLALGIAISTMEDVKPEERTAARFLASIEEGAAIVIDGTLDEHGINISEGVNWLCQFTRERFGEVMATRSEQAEKH